jgi:uncharacterized protein YndB with AHSA1/START domain
MKPIDKIGRVSNQSVLKCTSKSWEEWIAILDKAGARTWTHQQIVALLKTRYKLGLWWQQGVTLGYEVHTGRRVLGQNLKGEYGTVATRTFPVEQKKAWKLLASPQGLAVWLKPLEPFALKLNEVYEVNGGAYGQVRRIKPGERVRLSWQEADWRKPSFLQAFVVARPKGKCMVVIQHESLKDLKLQEKMREHWKKALSDLLKCL